MKIEVFLCSEFIEIKNEFELVLSNLLIDNFKKQVICKKFDNSNTFYYRWYCRFFN